jgi:hypothetical protein
LSLVLGGEQVPVVESYKYLGFPFFRSLSLLESVDARVTKALKCVGSCTTFLSSSAIPFAAKLDVIRSAIFPVVTFGGEVLGMGVTRVRRLESVWGKCVRMLTKGAGQCGVAVLIKELGISSVHAAMSGMRARALGKYGELRTVIHQLVDMELPSVWARGSHQWLRRAGLEVGGNVREAVDEVAWEKAVIKRKGAGKYEKASFGVTNDYIRHYCANHAASGLDAGIKMLVAARCGALWTAERAARRGIINMSFLQVCPCCGVATAEDEAHLLFSCSAWEQERSRHLQSVLASLPAGLTSLSSKVTLVLGGAGPGGAVLPGWSSTAYLGVARFMQAISVSHASALWSHSTLQESRSPDGHGSSAMPSEG